MKNSVRSLVRLFWGVTASLLILLAVLVQVGRSSSFLVADYRQDLADYWSAKLQLDVTIAEVSLEWQGLMPELMASGVAVTTDTGDTVARLVSTRVELLLLPSLLQLQPVVSELQVEGVALDFLQDQDGYWSLQGIPLQAMSESDDSDSSNVRSNPFNAFLFGRYVQLQNADLEFTFRNGQQFSLQVPEITLNNTRDFHRLSMRMDIGEQKDMVALVIEGEGDPRQPDAFSTKGYLRVLELPMDKVVAALPKQWLAGKEISYDEAGSADLELWLDSTDSGFGWTGRLEARQLPALAGSDAIIKNLSANLQGYWNRSGAWQLLLESAQIDAQENLNLDVQLGSAGDGEALDIAVEKLPLGKVSRLAQAYVASDSTAFELLQAFNVRGDLNRVKLRLPLQQPEDFELAAELDQVALDSVRGAPGLTQVDGYVYANKSTGRVELDSRNGFSMHYNIYADTMAYHSAYGTVAWHLLPDENSIKVNSSQLSLRGDDGSAEGYLYLDLPWRQNSRASEMILQIGLTSSQAQYHSKYVPEVIPEPLHQWLDNSLGTGDIDWAGFIYRGSFAAADHQGLSIQLALEMSDASLNYHPKWPELRGIDGSLLLDNGEVTVAVTEAQLYDSKLTDTLVQVVPNTTKKNTAGGMLLHIDSTLAGPASDGLRALRETMLRDTIGDSLDSWALSGDMTAALDLSIPLNSGATGARQNVDVTLSNSQLALQELNLEFEQLAGRLNFNDRQGLSAKKLQGRFFEQPFKASISSEGKLGTQVTLNGKADSRDLAAWLKRPELLFLEGKVPFNAELSLPQRSKNKNVQHKAMALKVRSDLSGTVVDLPAPFATSAQQKRALVVDVSEADGVTDYRVSFDNIANFWLQQAGESKSPLMALGLKEQPRLAASPTFNIHGELKQFDFLQWKAVSERYRGYQKTMAASGTASASLPESLQVSFNTYIEQLALDNFELENIQVSGGYQAERWLIDMVNPEVKGRILAFDDARPISAAFDYIRLPAIAALSSEPEVGVDKVDKVESSADRRTVDENASPAVKSAAEEKAQDLLAGINPDDLPAVDFSTKELMLGPENYGQWKFDMRPSAQGLAFNNIQASLKGLSISGRGDEDGAQLLWQGIGENATSQFRGVLSSADLSSTLQQFNQPGIIESETANFSVDLGWQGSPAAINLTQLEGQLGVDIRDGRFLRDGNSGNNPLLRLLGLLNFDTLLRRLKLDFSDMYKSGMVFDSIEGDLQFSDGNLYLEEPLNVRTPSSRLQLAGTIDLQNEQLDTTLVAALPIASPLALVAALTAGLPVAAGVYIVGKIFEDQVDKLTSVSYRINGSWAEPQIEFGRVFDSKAAKRSAKEARQKNAEQAADSAEE